MVYLRETIRSVRLGNSGRLHFFYCKAFRDADHQTVIRIKSFLIREAFSGLLHRRTSPRQYQGSRNTGFSQIHPYNKFAPLRREGSESGTVNMNTDFFYPKERRGHR